MSSVFHAATFPQADGLDVLFVLIQATCANWVGHLTPWAHGPMGPSPGTSRERYPRTRGGASAGG